MKDSIKNSNYEQFSSGEEDGKKRRRAKSSVFKICLLIISVIILSLLIYIAFFKTEKNSNETHPLLEPGQKAPVLVADIGGTNCRLRLIKLAADWEAEPEVNIFIYVVLLIYFLLVILIEKTSIFKRLSIVFYNF